MRLLLDDDVEALQKLPSRSVVLIFVYLPCELSNGGLACHVGKCVSVNKGEWDKGRSVEENLNFILPSWKHVDKFSCLMMGCGFREHVTRFMHVVLPCKYVTVRHIRNEICWYKPCGTLYLAYRMFA